MVRDLVERSFDTMPRSRMPWQFTSGRLITWATVSALLIGNIILINHALSNSSTSASAAGTSSTSTLVPLFGDVELQQGDAWEQVTSDAPVHSGDHVRTGPNSYGVITYFD